MSKISTLSELLDGLTGNPYVCPAARSLTGRNLGRLLRDYKTMAALNAALPAANGSALNMDLADSYSIGKLPGTYGIELVGHCGLYYDFGVDDTYIDVNTSSIQGGMQDLFDNRPQLSIGFAVYSQGGKQTMLHVENSDFKVQISASNVLTVTVPVYQNSVVIDAEILEFGTVPANQWSTHLLVFDGPNRTMKHYRNGVYLTSAWAQAWQTGTETFYMLSTTDNLRIGSDAGSPNYNFTGKLSSIFMTARSVSVSEANRIFYEQNYVPDTFNNAIYVIINDPNPAEDSPGVNYFSDLSGDFTCTVTSADVSGDVFANGHEDTTGPQKMIDSEGYFSLANVPSFGQLSSVPAIGSGMNFTLSTWVKPKTGVAGYNHVISMDGGPLANDSILISISGASSNVYVNGNVGGNAKAITSTISGITVNAWNHIAFSIDLAASGLLYVNGELDGEVDATNWAGYNFAGFTQWMLGSDSSDGSYINTNSFAGFSVSTDALDSTQVITLANLTKPNGVADL